MKRVIKTAACMLSLLVVFCSCSKRLKSREYVTYVEDSKNGLKKTIDIGDWEYSVQYKPYEYMALFESQGNTSKIGDRKNQLAGTAWFNISFRLKDGTVSPLRYSLNNREEYNQRYNYFLNQARRAIRLVYDGTDTLRPIAYEFVNNFNLTPQETMVVGFELPKGTASPEKDMQIAYSDEVFKNGIIKAKYRHEDINNIPNLIY